MTYLTSAKYETTKKITENVAFFFLALAVLFKYAKPESIEVGFWVCVSLAFVALGITTYNDIKHEKWGKLKERVAGVLAVGLLTAAYFLFIA